MNKLTSNKGLVITLVAAGALLLIFNIMGRKNEKADMTEQIKDKVQNPDKIIQPKSDIKERIYTAITPSASGKKIVVLNLNMPDAKLTSKFLNGEPEVVEAGTFTEASDFVTLLLVDRNGEKAQVPQDLTFNKQEDGTLVLLNPELEGYGSEGLTMSTSNDELSKTSWYWQETLMNNDERIAPTDPKKFKLTFIDQVQMSTTTDCNSGSGTYYTSGNKIAFGPMATTNMYCEGSLETEYFRDLNQVETYMVEGTKLVLMLPFDSGSMVFEKATD